jgi:DNA-binding transcriptional LysR family regulator
VIQQMNNLEQSLEVKLFQRTKHGIELTEAGAFLQREAASYIQKGALIRSQLQTIDSQQRSICVGTSFTQKVRLLYELWVLFTGEGHDYDIRMVNMDKGPDHIREAELVECVYANLPWQTDWDFLKVCDMTLGCAVPKHHPLAAKKKLSYEDLKGSTIAVMKHGSSSSQKWKSMCADMEAQGIHLIETGEFEGTFIWECACKQYFILAPMCWQDILFDNVVLPCNWDYTLSYGFCYRRDPSAPVREFLDFIQEVYYGKNWKGAVPVF